jgi:predicted nucleic acid-binding protein
MWQEVTQERKGKILTSTLSIAEVAHATVEKERKVAYQDIEDRIKAFWQDPNILMAEASRYIMESARGLMRSSLKSGGGLRAGDAIQFATGKFFETNGFLIQEFNTYDDRLFKYNTLINMTICEPHYEPKPTTNPLF